MRKTTAMALAVAIATTGAFAALPPAWGGQHGKPGAATPSVPMVRGPHMVSPGLMIPAMDAARGRALFASKGCVACHAVRGIGGPATPFDASTMTLPMNPFEFAARMWRGAEAMIALQRDELGEVIELSGQELADIIAFVHDGAEQRKFKEKDIPHNIRDAMTGFHKPGAPHGHAPPAVKKKP